MMCRVLLLDMLLGNPDRLPCQRLMWAGNPGNLLAGRPTQHPGASTPIPGPQTPGAADSGVLGNPFADRLVAIDARVQRRPPKRLVREEDRAVERTAELVLNDSQARHDPPPHPHSSPHKHTLVTATMTRDLWFVSLSSLCILMTSTERQPALS